MDVCEFRDVRLRVSLFSTCHFEIFLKKITLVNVRLSLRVPLRKLLNKTINRAHLYSFIVVHVAHLWVNEISRLKNRQVKLGIEINNCVSRPRFRRMECGDNISLYMCKTIFYKNLQTISIFGKADPKSAEKIDLNIWMFAKFHKE